MNIAVIGAGYVGLVTGACLASRGNRVIVVEKDPVKLLKLQSGLVTIYEPGLEDMLSKAITNQCIRFTNDIAPAVADSDVLFLCVGTPSLPDGSADLSQVENAMKEILKQSSSPFINGQSGSKVVVVKSTVPVGTAERLLGMARIYEERNAGAIRFELASNPEFLREGVAIHDFMQPDRIVIGASGEEAKERLSLLYEDFQCPKLVTDTNTAEMIKYASNSFLATKISFINMVSDLCDQVQADVTHVAKGMGYDKRIGDQFLKAGIGFGGSCFPKDLNAFAAVGRKHHVKVELLEQVIRINLDRPRRLLDKLKDALWVLKGKKIAVLGLTFKPNTDDVRDCPASHVIGMLLSEQAAVIAYDPVGMGNFNRMYPELSGSIRFARDAYEACAGSDGVLLLTEWPAFKELDWDRICAEMELPFLLDARRFLTEEGLEERGFRYS